FAAYSLTGDGGERASDESTSQTKKHTGQDAVDGETLTGLGAKGDRAVESIQRPLAAAGSLSFTAVEVFEEPSRHGHPLAYATRSDVTLRRPDRLRVVVGGDGPASEFYYDGKAMMAFAPDENLL